MKTIILLPLIILLTNCTSIRVSNQTDTTLKGVYAIYSGAEGEQIGYNIAPGGSCKTSRDLLMVTDDVRVVGLTEDSKKYEVSSVIEPFKTYEIILTPSNLKK